MKHASLGASSAERWMNCPGSINMGRGLVDRDTKYAREGTAAHKLAEMCLTHSVPAETYLGTMVEGFEVDSEMVEAVQVFLDHVTSLLEQDDGAVLRVEQTFDLKDLNPPGKMFGTSDVVVYQPDEEMLHVCDLKFGTGVIVEVVGNQQLRYYALGALLAFESENPGLRGLIKRIRITIVQPRVPHRDGLVRSEDLVYDEVVSFAVELLEAARATADPDAPLIPGEWCRFCRAAPRCPSLSGAAIELAQREFEEVTDVTEMPDPRLLSLDELERVIEKAPVVEKWFSQVRAYIHGELTAGREVPGFKLVDKRGTRKWKDDDKKVLRALKHFGLKPSDVQTKKLMSPAQVEKVLKQHEESPKVIVDLWEKVSSGHNVALESDPRPAAIVGPETEFTMLPSGSDGDDN